MGPALAVAFAFTASPPALPPLTFNERQALLKDWAKWNTTGFTAYQKADYGVAQEAFEQGLAVARRLYAKVDFPDGHENLGRSLNNLGGVLVALGKTGEAELLFREALDVRRRLFPKLDHPTLADSLEMLALVLGDRGKLTDAEGLLREAVDVLRRVHSGRDHRDVARSLDNLAAVLMVQEKNADAESLLREVLEMRRRLFPNQDHPDVVASLSKLAYVSNKPSDAEPLHREALDMLRRLYPKQDRRTVAICLRNLATVMEAMDKLEDAESLFREGFEMFQRLYPNADQRDVAASMSDLAGALMARGKVAEAAPLLRDALGMQRRLTADSTKRLADGDALSLAAWLPSHLAGYLSNALARNAKHADMYSEVFADRGAVTRIYEQRQLQARATTGDPMAAKLLTELADARARRAEMIYAPATKDAGTLKTREEELKRYEVLIQEKSAALAERFTPVARLEKLSKATPADLQKTLPADAVVVDFLRWVHTEHDPKKPGRDGEKRTPKYLAFVVTKSDIKWLDLGPADKIEAAVTLWREAITDAKNPVPADLGARVRELVWQPVRKALPDGTKEVFISPDAALCRLPWVALPGDKPGTVLLEDEFAIATIPHAPFLIDHLWERDKSIREKKETLVVGGVDFDAKPASKPDPKAVPPELLLDAKAPKWKPLAGSKLEADGLLKLASDQKREATAIRGADATPAAVLQALPNARHAHFATHGFFADAKFRSAFQLDEKDYRVSLTGERIGRAMNSPLVMTGLVLAGANDPNTPGRGVVTGESLVDLDLSGLELAVLSACETGVGDVAGGEGTFGLQRAFHTAGTRNVVASLWSVSDAATAALMGEFYRQLWEKNLPPMQALKAAQLKVLRTDRKGLGTLALRGPEASGVKDTVEADFPPSRSADGTTRNHPALWAAFTLSGPGR